MLNTGRVVESPSFSAKARWPNKAITTATTMPITNSFLLPIEIIKARSWIWFSFFLPDISLHLHPPLLILLTDKINFADAFFSGDASQKTHDRAPIPIKCERKHVSVFHIVLVLQKLIYPTCDSTRTLRT